MASTTEVGRAFEDTTLSCFKARKLNRADRNYRIRRGEIDLLISNANTLVFVEVRYRRSASRGSGLTQVTGTKSARIVRSTTGWLQRVNLTGTVGSASCPYLENLGASMLVGSKALFTPNEQRWWRHGPNLLLCTTLLALFGCSTVMDATNEGAVSENLGKRTLGTVFDDEMVESKASINIRAAHADLKQANVRVIAFNRAVLLVGQVSNEELRKLAEHTVRNLRHVERVHNELAVAGKTAALARVNDRLLSLKVKGRLAASKETDANRIKVVTENGVVYLMGLLTRAEADAAVEVARKTGGVQKIVKVFQYLN